MTKMYKMGVLVLACLCLSACSIVFGEREPRPIEPLTKEEAAGKPKAEETEEEKDQAQTEEAEITYPYTIKDYRKKEIVIDKKKEKIISLSPSANEIFGALDSLDSLYGAIGTESIEGDLNLDLKNPKLYEEVLKSNPDLILYDKKLPDYVVKMWEEKGIPCYLMGANSLEGIIENVNNLGKLVGSQKQAQILTKSYNKRMEEWKSGAKSGKEIKVFFELSPSPLQTVGSKTVLDQALTLLGGKNVASNLYGYEAMEAGKLKNKEIDAYVILYNEKNANEKEERLLELEGEKNPKIKKFYLLQVEDLEDSNILYFDVLEELGHIVEDAGQEMDKS